MMFMKPIMSGIVMSSSSSSMMSMMPLLLCTIPIRNVEAVWYSEVCYTGPKYKVRVDEVTGKLVPVTITTTSKSAGEGEGEGEGKGEGDSSRSSGVVGGRVDPFYDTNNVLPETLITINRNDDYNAYYNTDDGKYGDDNYPDTHGDDILDDDDHATNDGQNRNRGLIDSISSMPLLLRSKRIWRGFDTVDTDEEFNDALIVVNKNHQKQEMLMEEVVVEADPDIAAGFLKRYLQQSKQQHQQNEKEKNHCVYFKEEEDTSLPVVLMNSWNYKKVNSSFGPVFVPVAGGHFQIVIQLILPTIPIRMIVVRGTQQKVSKQQLIIRIRIITVNIPIPIMIIIIFVIIKKKVICIYVKSLPCIVVY